MLCLVLLCSNLTVAFAAEDENGSEMTVTEQTASSEDTDTDEVPETTAAVPETTETATVPETTAAATVPETTVAATEETEATEPTVPETTVPETTVPETQEEGAVYTLHLTHVFRYTEDGKKRSIQASETRELREEDFVDGFADVSRFALKAEQVTVTEAEPVSLDSFTKNREGGAQILYAVKDGWKPVKKTSGGMMSKVRSVFTGTELGDITFEPLDVVTVNLTFEYSRTGGLAGNNVTDPQTVEMKATKQADGSYTLDAYDLPQKDGFRIVLNPSPLNEYLVSKPTGTETPEELAQKLEDGGFNVDVENKTVYYYQETGNEDHNEQNPNFQNRYSTEYNNAWNAARKLTNDNFTAEAKGTNPILGANKLENPILSITLTAEQLANAAGSGLSLTVYYRRNATWYTVNHWVPESLATVSDAVLGEDGQAITEVADGVNYVLQARETLQGRVGATTAAKAMGGTAFELVSPVSIVQELIGDTGTVVNIRYAAASSYRIIFDTDYTYIPRQQVDMHGQVNLNVAEPSRTGYTFGGWQYLKKGTSDQYEPVGDSLTVNEELIKSAELVQSGDVMAIHLYPRWVPDKTNVRVVLWTENLTGTGDVQAYASDENSSYYSSKYATYINAPVTHLPQVGTTEQNYSNVGSFIISVNTDSSLVENGNLLNTIQTEVENQFDAAMGESSECRVRDFYRQAAFEIVHEEGDQIHYDTTTANADGKTMIYVYFTRNIYELLFTYYGEATTNGNTSDFCVAVSTNGYSFSNGAAVPNGNLNFGYSTSHNGGNGTDYGNGWMRASVTSGSQMPVPQTITIRAKYGADLRNVWPVARAEENVNSPDNIGGRGSIVRMISWGTTDGKYCEGGFFNSGKYNQGEPTIMGTYAAMSAEIVADPAQPVVYNADGSFNSSGLRHNLVAYWFNGGISHYRNNHCFEIPDLNVTGLQKVSIYNNDTTNQQNFLYLVPVNNETVAKYAFDDLMRVSYVNGTITYDVPDGGYYAVREYNGSYYAVARQVDTVSSNSIENQNPSARLHMTRANNTPDHSTWYANSDGSYTGTTCGTQNNPYDLYFYYNRDRYIITYMAPSNNSSTDTEVTLGTIELPYGAQVTKEKYGFPLDYQDTNQDSKYPWTHTETVNVCPDRATDGQAVWDFEGWALGPGGVNMQWTAAGEDNPASFPMEGNLRLYAIWDAPTYTVTFHLNGGNVAGNADNIETEVPANTRFTANGTIPRPLREGYTLVGWYNADENGSLLNGAGQVVDDVSQAVAFDFDQAVSSNLHAVAVWQTVSTVTFSYNVYYVTLTRKDGDTITDKVLILDDEIVETGGAEYWLLEQDAYPGQTFIQDGTLNLTAKKFSGYVPQDTNKSLVMENPDTYDVIFYYNPTTSYSHTVRFVLAGTETGTPKVVTPSDDYTGEVKADKVVITPKSEVVKQLEKKGFRLVSKIANNKYEAADTADELNWVNTAGEAQSTKTLTGKDIPSVITYLVEPIPYTVTYKNADGSPAAATAALNALTNPAEYRTGDHFSVTNPASPVFDAVTTKWYKFAGWTLGESTQDTNTPPADGLYNPLEVQEGTTGNLTFIAKWAAVEARDLGDLTVTKTVAGNAGDQTREFSFTVDLHDESITGIFGQGTTAMSFTKGVATFTLRHGESKTATGLLQGLTYEVKETDVSGDGYVTTKSGDTGKIGATLSTAAFTNTKNEGTLTITKKVEGTYADHTKKFDFTILLSSSATLNGQPITGGAEARFQLADSESATVTHIPMGTTYHVEESGAGGYLCNPATHEFDGTISEANLAATANFVNTYSLTPLTVDSATLGINGTKTMEGRDFQAGDSFTFQIRATENSPENTPLPNPASCTVTPNSGNTVDFAFGRVTFTAPGEYLYVISEVNPQTNPLPGVSYDAAGYRLTVTVANNGNGTLSVTNIKIERSDRTEVGQWVELYNGTTPAKQYCDFFNTYSAGEQHLNLTGSKVLTNKKLSDYGENQFEFILTAENPNQPMPAGSTNGVYTHKNLVTGGILIPDILFQTENVGHTYHYTITEKQPTEDGSMTGKPLDGAVKNEDGKWVYRGVTYDDHVHTVDVTVGTTNQDGEEVITLAVSHDRHGTGEGAMSAFTFTNVYNAVSEPLPLTGTKRITGREFQQGDQFTFNIVPLDGAPAPKNDQGSDVTQVILAASSGSEAEIGFGTLKFTAADMKDAQGGPVTEKTFRYEITEAEGTVTDMVYDTAKRTVEIHVTDDGGVLKAQVVNEDALVWNNRFTARANLTISKTVAGNGGDQQKQFIFTVTLTDANGNNLVGDFGATRFTLKHGENRVITGIPVGTNYTVVEVEANQGGYVTTATGDKGVISENGAVASFTNTRDIVPGKLTVTKTVTGLKGDKTKAFTFVVTLSDETINGEYGEMTFVNGRAEFTLKHGERKTAEGLPAGVEYTVKEGDNEGYTVRRIGDTGVIREGRTAYARFTNRKTNLDNQPRTGDETRLGLWIGLTALCFLGAVVSLMFGKKKSGKYRR